ncbi:P-loop containing nucleoside triphosphate hydrolase protein, partial [Ramaria rubella]
CPSLIGKGGVCLLKDCQYLHVRPCLDCQRTISETEYASHLDSDKHKRNVSHFIHGKCRVCGFHVPLQGQTIHLTGNHHKNRVLEQQQKPPGPRTIPRPFDVDCKFCGYSMHHSKWPKHVSSPEHAEKVQFASLQSAIGESEQDKSGVSVSPTCRVSICNHTGPGHHIEPTIAPAFRSVATASELTTAHLLLSFTIADARSPTRILKLPYVFTKRSDITITIVLVHYTQIGRYTDRIQLIFHKTLNSNKGQFVITRAMFAAVGVKEDYESLKPKAAYIPRKPNVYVEQEKAIPGVRPPTLTYVDLPQGRLLQWKVPKALSQVLRSGDKLSKVLKVVKKDFFPQNLISATYKQHFDVLLYIEEEQSQYDENEALLEPILPVPGLSEKRPSLIIGDCVLVRRAEYSNSPWYEGYVHQVLQKAVKLQFHNSFHGFKGQKYCVRFKVNRGPFKRMHQALAEKYGPERLLFPSLEHIRGCAPPSAELLDNLRPFNRTVFGNDTQKLAVASILGQSAGSVPFLIFGPPGTGKTVTIVETIRQLLQQSKTRRILACAPSNAAADIIANRLRPLGVTQLFRLVALSRDPEHHDSSLVRGGFVRLDAEGYFSFPTTEELGSYRVIVCTCVSSFWLQILGLERGHFSHIFVDEAGQVSEPETTIPIRLFADDATNVVLSGDPKQLRPIVRSDIAKRLGMAWSYLERLMAGDAYQFTSDLGVDDNQRSNISIHKVDCTGITIVRLNRNFRSHPSIIRFSSEQFYNGSLLPCAPKEITHSLLRSHEILAPGFPVIFRSLSGKDDRESNSPSFFNIEEVSVIKRYITALKGDRRLRLTDKDFGVISPYHAQCLKIGYALRKFSPDIKVGSVEEFQGQERRIILISTVRSSLNLIQHDVRHALGFVANARRFNVAVTRARALLIVVGDPRVLALDPVWRAFLTYVQVNGGWTGNPIHWDPSETTFQSNAQWEMTLRAERDKAIQRAMEIIHANSEALADDNDANIDRPWREDE